MELLRWLVFVVFAISQSSGRVCLRIPYLQTNRCSYSERYTARCGLFGWSRCVRYRTRYRTCFRIALRNVCCPGFAGDDCSDINECTLGTHNCQHYCVNTIGSFYCTCRRGYYPGRLIGNVRPCLDINECQRNNGGCERYCRNHPGSYSCSCPRGYRLRPDRRTCYDINECFARPCHQRCINIPGSYRCDCFPGFQLMGDRQSCRDFDECILNTNNPCAQNCANTVGSYMCSCNPGFSPFGNNCEENNECDSSPCLNGGTCIDGDNSYICQCKTGTTGPTCDTDIDECLLLKGGCEENCVNTVGSFSCGCTGNKTLNGDGKTCSGGEDGEDVFERHELARQLLPRGCATLYLAQCTDGNDIDVYLSSTSVWYRVISNGAIYFTFGIVFVEVSSLSLPISLNGVTVTQGAGGFQIDLGTNGRTESDGNPLDVTRTEDCFLLEFAASDIIDFISSVSFLNSYLDSLLAALPPWLGFGTTPFSALDVSDLQTGLVYGRDMDDEPWCAGAPVLPSHLYSVFKFTSAFSLSLYGNTINIPKPLNGRKFCLIVDICFSNGGTVFLMLPEESRDLLLDFDFFMELAETQGLIFKPRGIGLSVVKEINVRYLASELKFWNGDEFFTYSVFSRANLWIGGEAIKESKALSIRGSADLYLGIPSPAKMLTAIFIDEWNLVTRMKASATPTLHLKLFGKKYSISFPEMAQATVDAYLSIGGLIDRQWCGETANPPGIFLSTQVTINPFKTIPVLKNWVISSTKLYAFVTSDPASKITDDMTIDILEDIIKVEEAIARIKEFIDERFSAFGQDVQQATEAIIDTIINVIEGLKKLVDDLLNKISTGGITSVIDCLTDIWNDFMTLKSTVTEFLDKTEFLIDETKELFKTFIKNEIDMIKDNLDEAVSNIRNQVMNAAKDYSGFGLKFTTTLDILGLKILGVDIEFVYSIDSLFQCSQFLEIKELFKGEKAARFLGSISKEEKLGYFLKMDRGVGIGAAFSIDSDKFVVQISVMAKILGIRADANLLIKKDGLILYMQGNIWNRFLATLKISAKLGKNWYQLTLTVEGKFVALDRKRRQLQSGTRSFNTAYLDALKGVISGIANDVQRRISQAQDFLRTTQRRLSQAQSWFDRKQEDVRNANRHFDSVVKKLENAKDRLERAKGPFERALQKLNAAQRRVDNICRIKTCSSVCIPGVRPAICKRGWFGYPCLKKINCLFRVPNPVCVAANVACRGVRALAFAALEAAKLGVRAPMLALDAAKAAISVAQLAVDKSRVVLDAARAVLAIAKRSLDVVKLTLEGAIRGLEIVKKAVGVGAKILELVIEYGVGSIINVRNCGFRVVLSTRNLPVFDIECEVNAFRLGWRRVGIRVNFNNIGQSLLQAARATINALKNGLTRRGRRKREVDNDYSTYIHGFHRHIRQAESGDTNSTEENSKPLVNVTGATLGFENGANADDENRISLYQRKCDIYKSSTYFLREIIEALYNMSREMLSGIDSVREVDSELGIFTISELENSVNLAEAAVDVDFVMDTFDLTQEEIENSVSESKSSLHNDSLVKELSATAELSRQLSQSNLEAMTVEQLLETWVEAAQNRTDEMFVESDCEDFSDCVYVTINSLYEILTNESFINVGVSMNSISNIEKKLIEIMNASDEKPIAEIVAMSESVLAELNYLDELVPFCQEPPRFIRQPENETILKGKSVEFECLAEPSDTAVYYSWYKNGDLVQDKSTELKTLALQNVTEDDEGYYECVVGNVVAEITSQRAWLNVTENIEKCRDVDGQPTHYEVELGNGEWLPMECALGTQFNIKTCGCDFLKSNCSDTYQVMEGDPGKYQVLVHGRRVDMSCPEGLVFNQVACVCDYPDSTTPTSKEGCHLYPVDEDPSQYGLFDHDRWTTMTCAVGTVFDPDVCGCGHDNSFTTDPMDQSTEESTIQSTEMTTTVSSSTCSTGLRPDPTDNTKYQQEVPGHGWITMSCAAGTVFDTSICTCNHPPT